MQTQTSNTLHNAIMEAGSKDRPTMLTPGNYVQWKSSIKRYIDTKPNHELIHHCLKNPLYKFTWADTKVPISEGSPDTRTESQMETYKTVSQDIRDQLNAEAEAVQIILTGIDTDIYLTVDACPNACEMWKAIERMVNLCVENSEIGSSAFLDKAQPIERNLKEVKRIFHYLWGTINMGLWYMKDYGFELAGFSDADYARGLYDAVNRGSRICVFIRMLCPSPMYADTINGL
nr:uncharacterized mitochondrial protein AtMg00810-like [Tanacetum cinerariifolium]